MSTPQIGVQIGEIHNNDTGGGNVKQPQADLNNSTSTVPGSGYPYCRSFIFLICRIKILV